MNKNKMSLKEFTLNQLWWSIIVALFFRKNCFTYIDSLSITTSKVIYWSLIIILTVCGFFATYSNKRNSISIMANAVLPCGIYLLITYFRYFTVWYWIIIGICIITVIVCTIFYTSKHRNNKKVFSKKQLSQLLHADRVIASAFILVMIISIGTNNMLGNPMIRSYKSSVTSAEDSAYYTVENHIDEFKKFDDELWQQLSQKEKLSLLELVKNCEISSLGITHEIKLGSSILSPATIGFYYEPTHQILIDSKHLNNDRPKEVLHTLLHEMYHALQYEQVKAFGYIPDKYKSLYGFSDYIEYAEEFNDYADANDDYFLYDNQRVEKQADNYAEERVAVYLALIEEISQ